ncbi:XkdX family protein [Staphylococcus sp. GRT3]|uniref:XkdX family protein n=2 Tax=Staphylococcus americanisciuri TaxID=2973940 RepID=A0ABT2F3X5_9STAP|nr:XkdX family protein [Staphylococcus americanisciuri]MCS4487180.1 XkdX family protein [Staphylococcus americanisciuri]
MHNLAIKYYNMGLYSEKQLALFVAKGFVSQEEFKELTGLDYKKVVQAD